MDNKVNNKASYEALFQLIFLLGGIVLAFAGLVLVALKFFGYPLLFEGVISIFVGLITIAMTKMYTLFMDILDSFTNVLDNANEEMARSQANRNQKIHLPSNVGMFDSGMFDGMQININDAMSPEQLQEMKEKFPHIAGLIDSVMEKGDKRAPVTTKSLTNLTLKELNVKLELAIGKDDFEEAARIKKEIDKR